MPNRTMHLIISYLDGATLCGVSTQTTNAPAYRAGYYFDSKIKPVIDTLYTPCKACLEDPRVFLALLDNTAL